VLSHNEKKKTNAKQKRKETKKKEKKKKKKEGKKKKAMLAGRRLSRFKRVGWYSRQIRKIKAEA